jgi:hypothetical protein
MLETMLSQDRSMVGAQRLWLFMPCGLVYTVLYKGVHAC